MAKVLTNATALGLRRLLRERSSGKGNRPEGRRRGVIRKVQLRGSTDFQAVVGVATLMAGELNRWDYPIDQVQWIAANQQFEVMAGGISDIAVNSIENGNTGAGVESGGVDVDGLPGTFALKPIGAGVVVFVKTLSDDQGDTLYAFEAMNAVDGTC